MNVAWKREEEKMNANHVIERYEAVCNTVLMTLVIYYLLICLFVG